MKFQWCLTKKKCLTQKIIVSIYELLLSYHWIIKWRLGHFFGRFWPSLTLVSFPDPLAIPSEAENLSKHNRALAIPSNFSGDLDQLEEMVKSMMEKSNNMCQNSRNANQKADRCKVCGKEGKGSNIKDHIEANHIEGIFLPCNLCGKTFRSRKGLGNHKASVHPAC